MSGSKRPTFAEVRGYHPPKNFEILIAKSCNLVLFGVLKHFNIGNGVPTRPSPAIVKF